MRLVFAALLLAAAQGQTCGSSSAGVSVDARSASGSYSCTTRTSYDVRLNVTTLPDRTLYFSTFSTTAQCLFSLQVEDSNGISNVHRILAPFVLPSPITNAKSVLITWANSQYYTCGSFILSWRSNLPLLRINEPLSIRPQNNGGFEYLALPFNFGGASLVIRAQVNSYQGIQPPSIFLSRGGLPVLETYYLKNDTVDVGFGRYQAELHLRPDDNWYGIGIFLYGTSTEVVVSAEWNYNLQSLTNGLAYNTTLRGTGAYIIRDITPGRPFLAQLSRAAPGGYPIAYFSSAGVPSPLQYEFVLDTTKTSYVSQTIANPARQYLITVTTSGQTDTFGFLTKLSW